MKSVRGIRAQIISGIVVITLAAIGFMGVLSISILQTNALTVKVKEAKNVARIFRIALPPAKGAAGFADYSRNIMASAGISSMTIKDSTGAVVFSEGRLPERFLEEKGERVFFEEGIEIYRVGGGFLKGPGTFLYLNAGILPGKISALSLSFTMPLSDISLYTSTVRRFIVFYAIADSVIIIALGIYFLSVFIIRPVKRLEDAASRVSGGDLSVRAEVSGNNEISSLASGFNTMADRLREEIERLARVNRELLDTQEELLKTSTLASVGRLAAGVAHEIGNPLGAISGYIEILGKGGLACGEEEKDILKRMETEISRIDRTVKEFLDISRPPALPPSPVNVNTLVRETVELLSRHKDLKKVDAELVLKEDIPPVIIHEDKLRQVFMNLFINAAEAMPEGGHVTVETGVKSHAVDRGMKRRKSDPDFTGADWERRIKEYVTVSFKDTGCGIKKEDMDKIFDPFFTTKEIGSGTGLGLFISRSIVNAYGGTIEVGSEEGKGSVFTVLIEAKR